MTNHPPAAWKLRLTEQLRSVHLLEEVEDECVMQLLDAGRICRLDVGQRLLGRNEKVKELCIVISGMVMASLSNAEGRRHILRPVGPGQILNIVPVLDEAGSMVDLDMVERGELLMVARPVLLQLMQQYPRFGIAIHRVVYARYREVCNQLADSILLTLRQRCARNLLAVMLTMQVEGDMNRPVTLKLSQSALADSLGYSRPKVNRELLQLQREGLVEIGYNRIHIPVPARLQAVLDEKT